MTPIALMQRFFLRCAWAAMTVALLIIDPTACRPLRGAQASPPIRIGVATSLGLLEGRESREAVQLAVAEINARGGVLVGTQRIPLEVVSMDLRDAEPGVPVSTAVERLDQWLASETRRGRMPAVVVGPFRSEVLLKAMDLFARYRILLLATIAMTPAVDAKVLRNPIYRYIFRISPNTKYLAGYLIETMRFLRRAHGLHRVYILNQDVAWARSTASQMIRLLFNRPGWVVVGQQNVPSDTTTFKQNLRAAAAGRTQVILPIFDSAGSGRLVEQWHAMHKPALLCGFVSPLVGPSAWHTFGGTIGGTLNAVFELGNLPSRSYPPAATFNNAFQRRYNHPIEAGHGPAPAYDAVYVLTAAITRCGSLNPEQLVTALEATDHKGAIGRIRFHKGHQVIYGTDPSQTALACLFQWTPTGSRRIVHPPQVAEGDIYLPPALYLAPP